MKSRLFVQTPKFSKLSLASCHWIVSSPHHAMSICRNFEKFEFWQPAKNQHFQNFCIYFFGWPSNEPTCQKRPSRFSDFCPFMWILDIFQSNFLHERIKKGQATAHVSGGNSATVWCWETNEPILETRNVGYIISQRQRNLRFWAGPPPTFYTFDKSHF